MATFGSTNPRDTNDGIQRFGSVIGLKPEMEQRYRELHAEAWESVQQCLVAANVHNYSIYVTELEGKKFLFSYFEYKGDDFEVDMLSIAENAETQRWWKETDPCQIRLPSSKEGENWTAMERVFFMPCLLYTSPSPRD